MKQIQQQIECHMNYEAKKKIQKVDMRTNNKDIKHSKKESRSPINNRKYFKGQIQTFKVAPKYLAQQFSKICKSEKKHTNVRQKKRPKRNIGFDLLWGGRYGNDSTNM